jgi:predicted NBD/HSP70 family sugar kinase
LDRLLAKATRQHTKDHNSRLVLRAIYDSGAISRADLARLTRLTRTTVSAVVHELIEQGLVEEVGHRPAAVGRTPKLLSVVDDARHIVAVSVTSAGLHGAVVNLRGAIVRRAHLALPADDGGGVLGALFPLLDDLIASAGSSMLGIGISTPGLIDTTSGVVRSAVNFDWRNLPLRGLVQERYAIPVYIANDSHAMALAEYMFGQGPHTNNLIVIEVGQGIGAGIILDGRLFYGDGYGAGEIGHVVVEAGGPPCKCGNAGCLEAMANVPAIVGRSRALAERTPGSPLGRLVANGDAITLDGVLDAFRCGDPAVLMAIAEAGCYLGIAVANLVAILNVQRIIITGQLAPFGEALCDAIRQEVARRVLPALSQATEIAILAQDADGVLLGASALLLINELELGRLLTAES